MTSDTALVVVPLSGLVVLAEALRRRSSVPAYVHILALGVGTASALIMWRAGTLRYGAFGNAFSLLLPPLAVYYFFFRAGSNPSRKARPHRPAHDHVHDRDV